MIFFLLNKVTNKKAFLEVKSVSLQRKNHHAEFPDSVTSRGKKHLENLVIANKQGYESYLFFLIQIEKCKSFAIASDIDPEYYKVFNNALKKNVNVICYDCKFTNKGILEYTRDVMGNDEYTDRIKAKQNLQKNYFDRLTEQLNTMNIGTF